MDATLQAVIKLFESEAKAQNRKPIEILLDELQDGLRAKLELFERKVADFERDYRIRYKDAAEKFEKGEIGDSMEEHKCYFDYLFLKGSVEEKKDIEEELKILERYGEQSRKDY